VPNRAKRDQFRFIAFANQMSAVRYILAREYGVGRAQLPALSKAIEERPAFRRISRRPTARPARVAALITNAWQTELVLNLPRLVKDSPISALSLQWSTVQLYYCVYGAASAWLEAKCGLTAPASHSAFLRTIADHVMKGVFPSPWGAACSSCRPVSFCGEIAGHNLQPINLQDRPSYADARDFLCSALRWTRESQMEEPVGTWKRDHGRSRIPRNERADLDARLRETTIFDFLYMLRRRANYADAGFFMEGIGHPGEAARFHVALSRIGAASLLLFEKLLCATYGKKPMRELAEDFVGRSDFAKRLLGARVDLW